MAPKDGRVIDVRAAPGEMMVYDGDRVYHRVTSQGEEGERLVLVLPLYQDPRFGVLGSMRYAWRSLVFRALKL